MPTYEYECQACRNRFEKFQRMTDEPEKVCPECNGSVRRVIFPAGVIFKGSGFYVTDARKSESTSSSTNGVSAESAAPTAEKAESKPAAGESSTSKEPAATAA